MQGHVEKAIPPLKACLRDREQLYGPEHIAVAVVLESLGRAFHQSGDLENATPLLLRALRIIHAHLDAKEIDPEDIKLRAPLNREHLNMWRALLSRRHPPLLPR